MKFCRSYRLCRWFVSVSRELGTQKLSKHWKRAWKSYRLLDDSILYNVFVVNFCRSWILVLQQFQGWHKRAKTLLTQSPWLQQTLNNSVEILFMVQDALINYCRKIVDSASLKSFKRVSRTLALKDLPKHWARTFEHCSLSCWICYLMLLAWYLNATKIHQRVTYAQNNTVSPVIS